MSIDSTFMETADNVFFSARVSGNCKRVYRKELSRSDDIENLIFKVNFSRVTEWDCHNQKKFCKMITQHTCSSTKKVVRKNLRLFMIKLLTNLTLLIPNSD